MRIVHVLHNFPPESIAGVEVHVMRLARTQVSQGHDVLVVAGSEALDEKARSRRERQTGLEVARLVRAAPPGESSPSSPSLLSRVYDARTTRAFAELIAKARPQVVHFHHLMNLCRSLPSIARQHGARVVISVHDYWFLCPTLLLQRSDETPCSGPGSGARCVRCQGESRSGSVTMRLAKSVLRAAVGKALLGKADALVVPSVFVADLLAAEGVTRRKIRHVPYGVPSAPATVDVPRPCKNGDQIVFGYVGSIKKHKGVAELVRAFMSLEHDSRARLEIYGDVERDVPYGRFVQYLGANNPRVRFKGAFPPDQVFDIMARLDFLVVPSLWRETGPQVALEALAAGVPVIGSDLGGLQEIVRNGENGLLFHPGDTEDLRSCMARVCQDSTLALPPQRARERKEVCTVDENAARMEEIYREVLRA